MHHVPSKMVLLSIPKVVLAARVIARHPMVCFAHPQQILAVSMHHVPSKMVLLSIPKVVRAARVIARHPMVCFVHLQ
jgi:hypothetical protein